ncbi:serine protease [Haematococcus lacustris]
MSVGTLPRLLPRIRLSTACASAWAAPLRNIPAAMSPLHSGADAAKRLPKGIQHEEAPAPQAHSQVKGTRAQREMPEHMMPAVQDDGQVLVSLTYTTPFMDAVVKVYCVHTQPDYSLPWQRKRQMTSTSSGFIATFNGATCLLTNAHSVDHHTQVKVKRRGDDRKFVARVLSLGVDCDVALLTVEEDEFWEGVTPLTFGPLPRLQDAVAVVGYPIGGDTISVTAGVVSRIEVTDYTHGSTDLLAIQIDAAINGGNSGGPVINAKGECCGIAFQALTGNDVENVGYVIPTPVVNHFLNDYDRTKGFTGFPALGMVWQRMESEALRRAYHMAKGQKGVLVRSLNPTSDAANVLQPDDVLLSFDGLEIACDGTVPFRTGERISFSYLISNKYVGDECQMTVLRKGEVHTVNVKLSKPHQLIPPHINNRDPAYFIVAGLVFTPVSEPYLQSEYGAGYSTEAPVRLLDRLFHTLPKNGDEEVVVLSQVLACSATLGYEDVYNVQLLKFNGEPVRNLRHLAELVVGCTQPFMRFDLDYNELVILETQAALRATADVQTSHSVPHLCSADLRKSGLAWPPTASADIAAESSVQPK